MMSYLRKKLQDAFCNYDKEQIQVFLAQLKPDGSFADVNYEDRSRGEWLTYQHIRRTALLSCAYLEDASLQEAVQKALDFWYLSDYRNPNWWYNDLGVPQMLRLILLNCDEMLESGIRSRMIDRLQTEIEPRWTGMNKLWFAENVIFRGVITGDADLIQKGSNDIAETIFVSGEGEEGIQVDASFAQHGMQLYNHGYGREFVKKSALWLELLHDTPYAIPQEKVRIITDLYLNGTAKMGRFDTMDYSAQSREIVRCYRQNNQQAGMHLYCDAAKQLMNCNTDPEIVDRLSKTIDFIEGKRNNPYAECNTAHWVLKYMTHQRNGYYASVRMASREVYGGDTNGIGIVNGENALDGFGAYGLCVYLRDGKEYEKIFPVMDWGCMPGTTTPDIELPLELGGIHESTFVGNVSDGFYGLSAMEQHKSFTYDGEDVTFGGRFAYFFLDEGVLHLGNNLHCNSKKEFHTTLDQCLLKGPVLADGKEITAEGNYHMLSPEAVAHHGKLYLNLDHHTWKLKAGEVKGSFSRIFKSESAPREEITNHTFTLVMPHGGENNSYCYAVLPAAEAEQADEIRKNLPFQILSNDMVQAVAYRKQIFAVFYGAAGLEAEGQKLSVDAPCMLIWNPEKKEAFLSTPDREKEQIKLKINDEIYHVNMPEDIRYRGSSIRVVLKG